MQVRMQSLTDVSLGHFPDGYGGANSSSIHRVRLKYGETFRTQGHIFRRVGPFLYPSTSPVRVCAELLRESATINCYNTERKAGSVNTV